jgi:sugar (pentulose or hexulose) kinase
MQYILAIDNGTQSVRAILFDLEGNIAAKARVVIEPYFSEHPGWAEQDPEYFWKSLRQVCQKLWLSTDIPKSAIAGVTLTTQRGTVVNVDRQGKPLRPAIIWLDQRRTEGLKPISGPWAMAFKATRMSETIAYLQAEAEASWIYKYQPEIWAKTHKYLLLSGYLTYRLTGRFADSVACQVGYIPFDYKNLDWSKSWDWKWQILPIDKSILPDLVPPTQMIGTITPQAADETGIPAGLPLIAAAADKACEIIGSGCLEPHVGCLSYGTTATINTTHRRYIEIIPLIPPFPSAIPNAYSLELQVYRGYWMVSWFKEHFGEREVNIARERGIEPEFLFDDLVDQVPPGSDGLILQPYWSPGIKVPGPEARGTIIGFNDTHTRAHIYRAIIEGIAYALREGKERTEKRSKIPITELRVSGGGSQSDAAMQITADIFGLPTDRPHIYDTSALGAAIDGAVGLGLHPDFDTAISAMTRTERTFEPNATAHARYDELYRRVYKRLYGKVQALYAEIQDIMAE